LTKGQYSPTSELGKRTKSTPHGSIDHPFNPLALVMGADATFVARSMDRDPKHLREMLLRSNAHKGTSFLEIYQNCNVFNDGAFEVFTDKGLREQNILMVEHGQPLIFGENNTKGILLDGFTPRVVNMADYSPNDLWIHDEHDRGKANLLVRFFDDPKHNGQLPRPFGVFYQEDRFCYEAALQDQLNEAMKKPADLDALLRGRSTWSIS
jgi:2-oxoglutarate ferredoxin oxidoreductase subunit beta